MPRTEGWQQRLYAVTIAAMGKPHQWGSHDCVTFAADCVQAICGRDPMARYRGAYDTQQGAARVMLDAGAHDLGELAALHLPEIAVAEAQRGDVVLCGGGPEGDFLGVVQGATAVGPARTGLVHVPMAQAKRAFRVEA